MVEDLSAIPSNRAEGCAPPGHDGKVFDHFSPTTRSLSIKMKSLFDSDAVPWGTVFIRLYRIVTEVCHTGTATQFGRMREC